MGRVVEMIVGLAAIGSIATFLGVRAAVRRTIRGLGRQPKEESHGNEIERTS